jgi:hypothetical protein
MPMLFHCHDCDKPTPNMSIVCDNCKKKRNNKNKRSKK